MRDRRRLLGDEGEGQAEAYLRRQGFRILGRNVRSALGELDLIADDGGCWCLSKSNAGDQGPMAARSRPWMRANAPSSFNWRLTISHSIAFMTVPADSTSC